MSEHGNHRHCPDCGGSDGHHFNDCIYDGVGSGRGYSSGGSDVWKWICVICMVVFAGLCPPIGVVFYLAFLFSK